MARLPLRAPRADRFDSQESLSARRLIEGHFRGSVCVERMIGPELRGTIHAGYWKRTRHRAVVNSNPAEPDAQTIPQSTLPRQRKQRA